MPDSPLPRRAWLAPAVITAVFVVLMAANVWSTLSQTAADPDVRGLARAAASPLTVVMKLLEKNSGVDGYLYLDPEQHALFVSGKGLLPAGEGRTFVLWVVPSHGKAPRKLGSFALLPPERPDLVVLSAPALGDVMQFEVSSERDPAVPSPTEEEIRAVASPPGRP